MNIAKSIVYKLLPYSQPTRKYAFKSDLKIKWVRPEKISCIKPAKSGDLEPAEKIDADEYLLDFRNSKELQTADENVKKLFTLRFASRRCTSQVYRHHLIEKTKSHNYDAGSIEVKLARWTGLIRAWQDIMESHPQNKRLKVKLKELIDKRKKHLKYLRRWDYKKFEWILDVLNIEYKPPPNEFRWVVRRESLVKLTDKYCDEVRQHALDSYRLQLEQEQPSFLEEKIRTLQFIRNEQKECGAEVSVTEEEINSVKEQLKQLKLKQKEQNEEK